MKATERRVFQKTVWDFYTREGRHSLPWRSEDLARPVRQLADGADVLDPYAIVVSEVMLQQTQVDRVVPKYTAWIAALPDFDTLALASTAEVLTLWQGLGYNRRALALKRLAEAVVEKHSGRLPREAAALVQLPGIGPYTAAAVRAFAFNEAVLMIETNIRAVFIHHFFGKQQGAVADGLLLPVIESTLDRKRPRAWYWALMDYGSYIKKLYGNPARRSARHVRQSRFEGSHRQVRGAVVRALTQTTALPEAVLLQQLPYDRARIMPVMAELEAEGFITRESGTVRIAE